MCATCGCSIDLGQIESIFAKDYRCKDCGTAFKGFGLIQVCPSCGSKKSERVR